MNRLAQIWGFAATTELLRRGPGRFDAIRLPARWCASSSTCTGKVDVVGLLMAFEYRADRSLWWAGLRDCHYGASNIWAEERVNR